MVCLQMVEPGDVNENSTVDGDGIERKEDDLIFKQNNSSFSQLQVGRDIFLAKALHYLHVLKS